MEFSIDELGWLRGCRHVRSPNYNQRPSVNIDLIVIHCISLPPAQFGGGYIEQFFCNQLDTSIDPYFKEIEELTVSSHFLIDRKGALTQFVSIKDRAWHCGVSTWQGRENCNDFSIGIELEGVDDDVFTQVQYDSLIKLVSYLQKLMTISTDSIVGHSDIAPTRKKDPGSGFDWQYFRNHLENINLEDYVD